MLTLPSILLPIAMVPERPGRKREVLRRWAAAGRVTAYLVAGEWYFPEWVIPIIEAMPRRQR
jgi:hypothetical protein